MMCVVQVENLNAFVACLWNKRWAEAAKFELAFVS